MKFKVIVETGIQFEFDVEAESKIDAEEKGVMLALDLTYAGETNIRRITVKETL